MIKRTLYFGSPAYLKSKNEQLLIDTIDTCTSIPMEDIGLVVLDHSQITITQTVLSKLLKYNAAVVSCNETHHPVGMFLNLDGHTLQSLKFKAQLEASLPQKKQLWQQTVIAKIKNQATLLKQQRAEYKVMLSFARSVKSGDSGNHEAQAAVHYWKHLFPDFLQFYRNREGAPPNNLLNYGYAILRAIVARSLIGSGLLPTLGIFHRNQYNAYCLADDIMEPYRPFVDKVVCRIVSMNGKFLEMTPTMKKELLTIPAIDVTIAGQKSPLMVAVQRTTASLSKCFEGYTRKIIYPSL